MSFPFMDELFQKASGPLRPKQVAIGAAILLILVLLLFFPILGSPALWRDAELIRPGVVLDTSMDDIGGTWFAGKPLHTAPAAAFLLRMENTAFGMNPTGYRLVAALCHAASALLIWLIVRRLHMGGAYLAALLFALHPVAFGTNAWISHHEYVCGLTFYLLAMFCYLNHLRATSKRWNWYAGAVLSGTLALLFSPLAISLPILLAFCSWWRLTDPDLRAVAHKARIEARGQPVAARGETEQLASPDSTPIPGGSATPVVTAPVALPADTPQPGVHRSRHSSRQRRGSGRFLRNLALFAGSFVRTPQKWGLASLGPLVPFVLLSVALAVLYVFWRHAEASTIPSPMRLPVILPALLAFGWYWMRALALAFYPVGLPVLSFALPLSIDPSRRLLPLLALLLVAAILILLRRRTWIRPLLFLAAFSAIALLPLAFLVAPLSFDNLINARGAFYFALPASAIAAAGMVGYLMRKSRAPLPAVFAGISLAAVAALMVLSWQRAGQFRHPETFWENVISANPEGPLFRTEAGFALLRDKKLDDAAASFAEVVSAWPVYAPAWDGIGQVLFQKGEYYVAVSKFDVAVSSSPADPNLRMRDAIACEKWGMRDKAIGQLQEIVKLLPDNVFAQQQVGLAYVRRGMPMEAAQAFAQVVKLAPKDAQTYGYIGMLATMHGDLDEARRQLETALRLDPDNRFAVLNLGYSYYQEEKRPEAKRYFEAILQKTPGNLAATLFMMFVAVDEKDWPQASRDCEALLRQRPNDPCLLKVLAQMLSNYPELQTPSGPKAVELAERVCRLTNYMDPRALQVLALIYAKAKRFPEADTLLTKAIGFAEGESNYPLVAELGQGRRAILAGQVPPNTDRIMLSLSDAASLFML